MLVEARSIVAEVGVGAHRVRPLTSVDLKVDAGEVVAVLGISGSGKTTLLRVLSGQLEPSSGEVLIDSGPVRDRKDSDAIGSIYQDYRLVPFLTAQENVSFALEVRGRPGADAWELAAAKLAEVGLDGLEDRYPHELSGGQQQRVSIARALVGAPRLIVADEPSAALDAATAHEIMTALCDVVRASGAALVVATHDPRVAEFADARYDLKDGALHRVA